MADRATIFISYAKEDIHAARRLYMALKVAGHLPWLDEENLLPGQQWKVEIRQAISKAKYFIAILSSKAISKRGYVQTELKQALEILDEFPESQIFVIPARLDECSPSHVQLRNLQWVDLFPSFDDGIGRILRVIGQQDTRPYEALHSMIDVFDIDWIGGGAFAIIGNREESKRYIDLRNVNEKSLRLARILNNPSSREICTFYGTACALSFQAEVSSLFPWATIKEISARVNTYKTPPKFEEILPLPFEESNLYYIEIDDPAVANISTFTARYTFQGNQESAVGIIRLNSRKPEVFVVRVNAKRPGIYNFDIELTASYKDTIQTVPIIRSEIFLFA